MSTALTIQKMALSHVSYPGYAFAIVGDFGAATRPYLHAEFTAKCSRTGLFRLQRTRKWLLSEHMSPNEIVQLAFKCVLTSIEHGVREDFSYMGAPVFSPRLDLAAVAGMWAETHGTGERRAT